MTIEIVVLIVYVILGLATGLASYTWVPSSKTRADHSLESKLESTLIAMFWPLFVSVKIVQALMTAAIPKDYV